MTTGRINQVAFLRDVRPACSSTHYLGRGEAITGQDHRSCRGTKCTSYERPDPYLTPWARRPQGDDIEEECGSIEHRDFPHPKARLSIDAPTWSNHADRHTRDIEHD
ncbi:hypothetical protein V6N13_008615 [Hibiscus sabdariffa]